MWYQSGSLLNDFYFVVFFCKLIVNYLSYQIKNEKKLDGNMSSIMFFAQQLTDEN